MRFDREAAWLRNPDFFPRFRATAPPRPLASLGMDPDAMVLRWEIDGAERAALVRQLTYHHCMQAQVGERPFVVSFCNVCHSAVGLDPQVESRVHEFSCGGLYHGQSLLIDDETHSYWDPLSGQCVHGRLAGTQLNQFSVEVTTVGQALRKSPDLLCYVANRSLAQEAFDRFGMFRMRGRGFLPPGFKGTMASEDTRRPRMEIGLGVVVLKQARWYSEGEIRKGAVDTWGRRELHLSIRDDGFPAASWSNGSRPLQFQCRWYGFAFSFPDCEIFESGRD